MPHPEERIVKYIFDQPYPVSPKTVATALNLKNGSVRSWIWQLLRNQRIKRVSRGYYTKPDNVATPSGECGGVKVFSKPRLHGLDVRVAGLKLSEIRRREVEDFGGLKMTFVFCGGGVCMVYVSCPSGVSLGYTQFSMVIDYIKLRLGVTNSSVLSVVNYELNRDFRGVILKGCKELTFKAFDESFKRFYNKEEVGGIRTEVRGTKAITPERAVAMLQGGVPIYEMIQANFLLTKRIDDYSRRVDDLITAQKFTNELLHRLLTLQERRGL